MVARLAETALALPEAYEEDAWTGVRWRIRSKTFAHVMVAQAGYESSFRDITGIAEPTTVLTFRASGDELLALVHAGRPFYKPPWSPDHRRHGAQRRHGLGRGGRAGHRELPVLRAAEAGAAARRDGRRSRPFRGVRFPPERRPSSGQTGGMHRVVPLKVHYYGTPVVLVSSTNPDGTTNLAPMSSAWWLGQNAMLGLGPRRARRRTSCAPARRSSTSPRLTSSTTSTGWLCSPGHRSSPGTSARRATATSRASSRSPD